MTNPYQSGSADGQTATQKEFPLREQVLVISACLILGCLISLVALFIPVVRDLVMPRFGWIGLLLGVNVLIFLGMWLKTPTTGSLRPAIFMLFAIAIINSWVLFQSGTVAIIENAFHDRLHSAWFWSVGAYALCGVYLGAITWWTQRSDRQSRQVKQ